MVLSGMGITSPSNAGLPALGQAKRKKKATSLEKEPANATVFEKK